MEACPAVGHPVRRAPIHLAAQGGRFLMHAVLGHHRIKTDDLVARQGKLGHGLSIEVGFAEKIPAQAFIRP